MTPERWTAVDQYFYSQLNAPDPILEEVLAGAMNAGLPDIHVSPNQGKLLHLLAKLQDAKKILEIGTLAGYSAICMARALPPGGKLFTLEIDSHHVKIAKANIARAGMEKLIDLRQGAAIKTLPTLSTEAPFDLVFIDADKPGNPDYFRWALRLSRKGTLIIVDNVVRKGEVINAASEDASVQGVRQLVELIASEPRVSATAMQTVGMKGYDGLLLAVVTDIP
jgi:predicted O-methyltransferase YrrM